MQYAYVAGHNESWSMFNIANCLISNSNRKAKQHIVPHLVILGLELGIVVFFKVLEHSEKVIVGLSDIPNRKI